MSQPSLFTPWIGQALEVVGSLQIKCLVKTIKDGRVVGLPHLIRNVCLIGILLFILVALIRLVRTVDCLKFFFNFIEQFCRKGCLLLRLGKVSHLHVLLHVLLCVESLDLLEDLDRIVLDWLGERLLDNLLVNDLDYEVEVLSHSLMLLLHFLFLRLIFLDKFVVLFISLRLLALLWWRSHGLLGCFSFFFLL